MGNCSSARKYHHCVKNRMIIMRGIPGSGKSFTARAIANRYPSNRVVIYSTDDYWSATETPFNKKSLWKAHKWNQERTEKTLKEKKVWCVIIDNTNVKKWEAKPYVKAAIRNGFNNIQFKEPTSWWWAFKTSSKTQCIDMCSLKAPSVPRGVLERMFDNFEVGITINGVLTSKK